MRRLIALVFALTIAFSAGPAQAATKSIPVKVVLTGIFGSDLVGTLESKAARCVKNRDVTLSGDSNEVVQSNDAGAFGSEGGNLYVPGAWSVKVRKSKRFGPAGHRKQCATDTADYVYDDPGPMNISFGFTPETGGTGAVSSTNPLCRNNAYLELYRGDEYVDETAVSSGGNYAFPASDFASAGNYQVRAVSVVPIAARPSGNLDAADCYGQSAAIPVAR